MKRMIAVVAALAICSPVGAMYVCAGADGTVSFQQAPCPPGTKQSTREVKAAPPSGAASAADGSSDQRTLERYQKERRVREIENAIKDTDEALNSRTSRMAAELDALHARKGRANNNLAGATYQQSIASEMQALATKYQAANDVDLARLKTLQADLVAAKAALGKQ